MKNEWKIGIVETAGDGLITFSSEKSDIVDTIQDGNILKIYGVNDFVYTKLDIDMLLLLKIVKVKNRTYDQNASPNEYLEVQKVDFIAEPMGTLCDNEFLSGASRFPMVGESVFGATKKMLDIFFSSKGKNLITMGTVNNYPTVAPNLDLRRLLNSHIAVVGNTGSGKSTTLRVLIDRINNVERNLKALFKLFVFDVHGDYSELKFAHHINVSNMHLSLKNLDANDWAAALLPSEKTQKPILTRALDIAKIENKKLVYAILSKIALENVNQDSFAGVKRIVTVWYEKAGGDSALLKEWKLNFGNETSSEPIIKQLETIIGNNPKNINELIATNENGEFTLDDLEESFEIVFGEEEVQGNNRSRVNSETMMARFRTLKYKYGNDNGILNAKNGETLTLKNTNNVIQESKFFVINLTGLDDDALRLVSTFLARSVFKYNVLQSQKDRNMMPFNYLYLDEAHRYVQNTPDDENTIFDKIAREGRKFNVYLGVISQIPSELSKVVLAQVGAYFIHRIQNSIDLEYIRKNVPGASGNIISRLPILPAGTAVLSGTAFDIPCELNIDAGNHAVYSASLSPLSE